MKMLLALAICGLIMACGAAHDLPRSAIKDNNGNTLTFNSVQKNVLESRCLRCHGVGGEGDVDLSSLEAIMANSDLVVPERPEESRLFTAVANGEMPPRTPLAESEIEMIEAWILSGAKP